MFCFGELAVAVFTACRGQLHSPKPRLVFMHHRVRFTEKSSESMTRSFFHRRSMPSTDRCIGNYPNGGAYAVIVCDLNYLYPCSFWICFFNSSASSLS